MLTYLSMGNLYLDFGPVFSTIQHKTPVVCKKNVFNMALLQKFNL